MKSKLKQFFGPENIKFIPQKGLVILSSLEDVIVQKFHKSKQKADSNDEKRRIVLAAADILYEATRCHDGSSAKQDTYPNLTNMTPERMIAGL
jgi:hypothetical protein